MLYETLESNLTQIRSLFFVPERTHSVNEAFILFHWHDNSDLWLLLTELSISVSHILYRSYRSLLPIYKQISFTLIDGYTFKKHSKQDNSGSEFYTWSYHFKLILHQPIKKQNKYPDDKHEVTTMKWHYNHQKCCQKRYLRGFRNNKDLEFFKITFTRSVPPNACFSPQ